MACVYRPAGTGASNVLSSRRCTAIVPPLDVMAREGLGSPERRCLGLSGLDRSRTTGLRCPQYPVDPKPGQYPILRDFRGPDALRLQLDDFASLPLNGRHTALVAALSRGFGDSFGCRSSMASRSAWPTAAITFSINLPVAMLVSRLGCRKLTECADGYCSTPTVPR